MPALQLRQPNCALRTFRLHKKITSIGSGQECDIVLNDRSVAEHHAQILFTGQLFQFSTIDGASSVFIGDKKKKKHELSHQDVIQIGQCELIFYLINEPVADDEANNRSTASVDLLPYRMLFDFSSKLLGHYEVSALIEALMDAVISVAKAEKGFLVVFEEDTPRIVVARNVLRENVEDAVDQLSDSIVAKAIRTRQPVIVSDALSNDEFSNALSIIRLNVSSVMCVPLLDGSSLIGLIYVGNSSVIGMFEQQTLEMLTIFAAQASLVLKNALLLNALKTDNQQLKQRLSSLRFGSIIGSSSVILEVYKKVERVAATDISVLITGETGTGKELIAREIHERSNRSSGPFITINCGAIPENLLESELFGHVKGAFTGAVANKIGKFQAADKGTLFLDEVGELPLPLQVKLLRAIQEKVIVRVGDTKSEMVDIRILAATNRDLAAEIKANHFREDLYYRLNVINIHLPPLRERGDDIVLIAKYLLQRFSEEFKATARSFSPNAVAALKRYNWPGNIRQLENHIKKAVILSDKAMLSDEELELPTDNLAPIMTLADAKEAFQRRYINEILARNSGNRTKTAQDLAVDPRTIFRHLEREDG